MKFLFVGIALGHNDRRPIALVIFAVTHATGLGSNIESMDDKYKITKPKKPETRQEIIQYEIEQLVKRRDATDNLSEKQKLNQEITKLFAQYERLKL